MRGRGLGRGRGRGWFEMVLRAGGREERERGESGW